MKKVIMLAVIMGLVGVSSALAGNGHRHHGYPKHNARYDNQEKIDDLTAKIWGLQKERQHAKRRLRKAERRSNFRRISVLEQKICHLDDRISKLRHKKYRLYNKQAYSSRPRYDYGFKNAYKHRYRHPHYRDGFITYRERSKNGRVSVSLGY